MIAELVLFPSATVLSDEVIITIEPSNIRRIDAIIRSQSRLSEPFPRPRYRTGGNELGILDRSSSFG